MQEWHPIYGFPDYGINAEGEVASHKTGHVLSLTYNQAGVAQVGLYKDGRLHRRSVALLVAKTYLGHPPKSTFTTPIHLDGDKSNCRVENLEWRPRWFAIRYHQQFENTKESILNIPIHVLTTDEYFERNIDCCMKYGLLAKEVLLAAQNQTPVFPTWMKVGLWYT